MALRFFCPYYYSLNFFTSGLSLVDFDYNIHCMVLTAQKGIVKATIASALADILLT